ncbi:MAG: type II secretion system F family protein [Acetobacteraceae bacterium]|nr:type II secretion system F family protein [Acetobacteraceae bacterium]
MNSPVLLTGAFVLTLTMLITGLVLLRHARRDEKLRDRLRMANGTYVGRAGQPAAVPQPGAVLARMVTAIGAHIASSGVLSRKTVAELEKALAVAGMSGRSALGMFIGCKILLLIGLPLVAVVVTQNMELDATLSNLLPAGAGILGLVGPDMVVRRLRNSYVKKVEASLPDSLDMLLICTQAGLPLEPALTRVSQEIRTAHPQIAWEFEQTVNELQMNSDVKVALNNLGERTGLESVKRLTTTLIQTMQYGTPLGEALRALASEMRTETLIRFEEKAARLPVLLTLPMVAFVLPCIFIVVAGPAALRLVAAFS